MTEMQASLGRYQLKHLDKQIKKRNQIAYLYINNLKDFWDKYNLLKKPNFVCSDCPLKYKINKECNFCRHAFYRLNLFINLKKINQIHLINELNKKKIYCSVGSCPEIYKEKIFKKLKFYPKKRLANARLLGATSIAFPINPQRSLSDIKAEINAIKKILNSYF
jgi:dTDP-4-amino-4,6-dideoxygalactose transaminase